jgi:PEP-CTERM motif
MEEASASLATVRALPLSVRSAPAWLASVCVEMLDFTGTITFDAGFDLFSLIVDNPFNSSHTDFLTALNNFSYFPPGSGTIFSVTIPAGQLPDLYAFTAAGGSSELRVTEVAAGAPNFFEIDVPFSVQVTAVPEPSALCLSASGIALLAWQRRSRSRARKFVR